MALRSLRYRTVKKLKRLILTLAPLYRSDLVHPVLLHLCRFHTIILSHRYRNRFPGDRAYARFNKVGINLFGLRGHAHFHAF